MGRGFPKGPVPLLSRQWVSLGLHDSLQLFTYLGQIRSESGLLCEVGLFPGVPGQVEQFFGRSVLQVVNSLGEGLISLGVDRDRVPGTRVQHDGVSEYGARAVVADVLPVSYSKGSARYIGFMSVARLRCEHLPVVFSGASKQYFNQ